MNKDLPAQEQIRFASVIRNDRKPSAKVSNQELGRRQQEAERLLLRTFGCAELKVELVLLTNTRLRKDTRKRFSTCFVAASVANCWSTIFVKMKS